MDVKPAISAQDEEQFRSEGYFVLERVIPEDHLKVLHEALDAFIAQIDAELDAAGVEKSGLNHRGKRYFIANRYKEAGRLGEFLLSPLMAGICRSVLGADAWLFWEQYVVKTAEVGMQFSWHQDSGYLKSQLPSHSRPYLTCWCALDDVREENGTIWVLPYSKAGTKQIVDHVRDEQTNDLVGYFGNETGVPIVAPAGSIAVFSTTVFHRSGANTTGRARRSYVAQYSAEPILREDGTPVGLVEPFLSGGRVVTK